MADLVPPSRKHRHPYRGVCAANHKLRPAVTSLAIGNVRKRGEAVISGHAAEGCCDANRKSRSHDTSQRQRRSSWPGWGKNFRGLERARCVPTAGHQPADDLPVTHASRADRPGSVRRLEGEHQAGASDLEGGAHAGAAEAAVTPEITGVERHLVCSPSSDTSEPCVVLRIPRGAHGGWQARPVADGLQPQAASRGASPVGTASLPPTHHADCSPTRS